MADYTDNNDVTKPVNYTAVNSNNSHVDNVKKLKYPGTLNLIPLTQRTKEEQKDLRVKGGIASGVARRKKKNLKELAGMLLDTQIVDKTRIEAVAEGMGIKIPNNDVTVGLSILLSMAREAQDGNYKAAEFIRDTSGQKPVNEVTLDANVMTDADRQLLDNVLKRQGEEQKD